jgi:hypothetical protein
VKTLRQYGANVWTDHDIDYGERWADVIQEKVQSCSILMVVMTPQSMTSRWVQRELNEAEALDKPIWPLLLEGERWFRVNDYQVEDVVGGRMPSRRFLDAAMKAAGGNHQPNEGSTPKLVNLADQLPAAQKYSRIYRGHKELIDHILVTQDLVPLVAAVRSGTDTKSGPRLRSIDDDPTRASARGGSDHAPITATFAT